jgi:Zn-dependent peptidase ImmA (M78 family)
MYCVEGLDASRMAARLWREYGVVPPIQVHKIAEDLGIRYEAAELPSEVLGMYVQTRRSRYIFVNSLYPPSVQMESGCHELVHALIHQGDGLDVVKFDLVDPVDTAEEKYCRTFASRIAMPDHLMVGAAYSLRHIPYEDAISTLSRWWKLERDTIRRRFWEMGLVWSVAAVVPATFI